MNDMDTPKKIWLIKVAEDEMIWANEPYPDGDELEEDIAEYRLASEVQADIDELISVANKVLSTDDINAKTALRTLILKHTK